MLRNTARRPAPDIRGAPRPLMMMEGIDSSFGAAMFIDYHSATTSAQGGRAHTIASATVAAVRRNGQPMSVSGINATIAGLFGVPVVMVSADEQAVGEVQKMIGNVEGAIVMRAISFYAGTIVDISRFFELASSHRPDLTP